MKSFLWFVIAVGYGFFLTGPLKDNDLFWHLNIGRWIVSNQTLPTQDLWTVVGEGKAWLPYSWLFETIVGLTYKIGGFGALVWAQCGLAVFYSIVVCYLLSVVSKDLTVGLLLGGVVVLGSAGHFALRPQTFAWIFFAITLLVGHNIKESKNIFLSLVLFVATLVLWSNMHITTLFGLLAILLWSFGRTSGFIFLLLGIGATFVTPHYGAEWITLFQKSDHPLTHQIVAEFSSGSLTQYPYAILVLLFFFAIMLCKSKFQSVAGQLVLAVLMIGAGTIANKFIPFALIAVAALTAKIWANLQENETKGNIYEGLNRLKLVVESIPHFGLTFLLASLIVVKGKRLSEEPIDISYLPIDLAMNVSQSKSTGPVLAPFGYGGLVGFYLSNESGEPKRKVVLDGRTNLIDAPVWDEFQWALYGSSGNTTKIVERFTPEQVFWYEESPLTKELLDSNEWKIVARSQTAKSKFVLLEKL